MSSQPLGITNFGAFTQLTAKTLAAALGAMGFRTTGNVFYCDPVNGSDLANGQAAVSTPGQIGTGPVASLSAGYALLRSGYNDVLVLMSNGLASGTARIHSTFTWAKNAAHLIGICAPSRVSQRARIANGTTDTAFANFFVVSGNGCLFSDVSWFQGFATGVAAEICMKVSGQRNVFQNCDIEGMGDATGAGDTGSRNLLLTAGENYFSHCNIGIDTVSRGANYSVEFQSGAARNVFDDCIFPLYTSSASAAIFYTAAAAALDRYTLLTRCALINAVKSGSTGATGAALMAASSGGMIVAQDSWWVGFTAFGADSTTKGQCYAAAPISTNAGGFATVMT